MPIYEYVCEACGRITEVMQRLNDPPPPTCPECGETRLARLVSRTTFQLKGGGWYSDLYGSQKKKPEAGGDASKSAAAGVSPAPAAEAAPSTAPATGGDKPSSTTGAGASATPGTGAAKPKDGAAR